MSDAKPGSLLARLQARREQASASRTRDLTIGDLVVRYRRPTDESYYQAINGPDAPPDSASDETIREFLADTLNRQIDMLIDACAGLYYTDGDGGVLPLAASREDGDTEETLTFQYPEALELVGGHPKGSTRENTLAFFEIGAPDAGADAAKLHALALTTWRGESLAEVGDILAKGPEARPSSGS